MFSAFALWMAVGGASLGVTSDDELFADFELLSGGYVAATSFVKPTLPLFKDGWYLASGSCGNYGARVTPDPFIPLLGGSGTVGLLHGLQSAALDLGGSYIARRFDPDTPFGEGVTLSFLTQVRSGLLLNPTNGHEIAEFVFSDDLDSLSKRVGVRLNTAAASGLGCYGVLEVLGPTGLWQPTTAIFPNSHLLRIEIVLYPGCDEFRLYATDLFHDPCERTNVGLFPSNGPIADEAPECVQQGGIMLTSRNGTALFDDVRVLAPPDGFFERYGVSCQSKLGLPIELDGLGVPSPEFDAGLRLSGAIPSAPAFLIVTLGWQETPFKKDCLVYVGGSVVLPCVPLVPDASGVVGFKTLLPPGCHGIDLYAQVFQPVPSGPGFGGSNGLRMAIR